MAEASIDMIRGRPLTSKSATWILVAAAVASTATLTRARLRREEPSPSRVHSAAREPEAEFPVGLRAETQTGALKLTWDRESALVKNATSGVLTIRDGGSEQALELSAAMVRSGSIVYSPATEKVRSKLTVTGPDRAASESVVAVIPWSAPALPAVYPAPATHPERSVRRRSAARISPPAKLPVPPEVPSAADPVRPRTLEVQVSVDETGKVVNAELLTRADVDRSFADAALQAAWLWRFEPARPGGQPAPGERVLRFTEPAFR
jgi:TonB family protein